MLEQTSLSARTQFEFGENHLGYSFDGDRKHRQFKVDYAELPKRTGFTLTTSSWLRRTGFLACSIGILHAGWAVTSGASMLAGTVLGGIGVFNLILHALSRRKGFTVLKTEPGEIRIIRDRRHDQILRELRTRRRARILELHGPRVIPRALLGVGSPRAPTRGHE
jgi:hypothetical protein